MPLARRIRFALACSLVLGALASTALGGCARQIGDGCGNDTDCSLNYDRRCDLTQQGGYCTIPECERNRCPGEALCIEFRGNESRLSRRFCMAPCERDGDCRGGYVCLEPTVGPEGTCPSDPGTGQFPECTRLLDDAPSMQRRRARFCVQAATLPP